MTPSRMTIRSGGVCGFFNGPIVGGVAGCRLDVVLLPSRPAHCDLPARRKLPLRGQSLLFVRQLLRVPGNIRIPYVSLGDMYPAAARRTVVSMLLLVLLTASVLRLQRRNGCASVFAGGRAVKIKCAKGDG